MPRSPRSLLQRGEVNYLESPNALCNELNCCASRGSKAWFQLKENCLVVKGVQFDTIRVIIRFDVEDPGRFQIERRRTEFSEGHDHNFPASIQKIDYIDHDDPGHFHLGRSRAMVYEDLGRDRGASEQIPDNGNDPWSALQRLEVLARDIHRGSLDVSGFGIGTIDVREQFARTITGDRYVEAFHLQQEASQLYREYAWDMLRSRAFSVTERGFCGVGSPDAHVGDNVAVVLGMSMPAILRHDGDADKYALQGECYVSGIMYGELMTSLDVEGATQEFKLV